MKHYTILFSLFVCSMFAASAETVVNENPSGLSALLRENGLLEAEELKIEGVLNVHDIRFLRSLAGDAGNLRFLDLKDCSITSGTRINALPQFAFRNSYKLERILLPSDLMHIEDRSLAGCSSLHHFEVPRGIKEIGPEDFEGTPLMSITVEEGSEYLYSDGCAVYSADGETLQMLVSEYKGSYTVPEGVRTIDYRCFYNCKGLTEINLPQSLECVRTQAFYGCSSLKSLCYPDNVKHNYGGLYENTLLETIVFGRGMVECWEGLDGCSNLKDVYAFMPVPSHAMYGYSGHCSFCYMPNPANVTLHVLPGTAEMYRKMEGWNNFKNIVEMSEDEVTGIQSILQDGSFSQGAEVLTTNVKPIYDLSGRRTSNTDRGIHIKDGRKVYE